MLRALMLLTLAGCGRVGFSERVVGDGSVDVPPADTPADTPAGTLGFRQKNALFGGELNVSIPLDQDVAAGSALVVFVLSQEQPVIDLTDDSGNAWSPAGTIVSFMTGSKVNAWAVCAAAPGPISVTATQSFNNGPMHLALYEIANATPTDCIVAQGSAKSDTAVVDQMVSGTMTSAGAMLGAFGAWFDEVSYMADPGDKVLVTARPTPPAPQGDTLASVVALRDAGPQAFHLTADHATLYAALLVGVR